MDDLISRQAAIDALGERPMVWTSDDDYALGERNQYDIDRLAIETVPSADVVEVVRCYECVWWDTCPSSTIAPTFHRCKRVGRMGTEANDFCSYGERKE